MSGHKGRSKKHEEHEEHVDERWMASYMDMVTVLMCMFIVLFAMSTVDANKFDQLRNSLATGFGQKNIGKIDTATGTVVPASKVNTKDQGFDKLDLATKELDDLKAIEAKINASLAAKGLQSTVEYQVDSRGLTIRLVNAQTFFEPNSVALVGVAPSVLDSIASVLGPSKYAVSVEGHADVRAPQPPYPTNWELSSGRAVAVLRRMVELGGVSGAKISAVGYGDTRPLADGTTEDAYAKNRRVDIVALDDAPEAVRALIPDAIAKEAKDAAAGTPSTSPSKPPDLAPPEVGTNVKQSPFVLPVSTASR